MLSTVAFCSIYAQFYAQAVLTFLVSDLYIEHQMSIVLKTGIIFRTRSIDAQAMLNPYPTHA